MNKPQSEQSALEKLQRLAMWAAGWAGDVAWFQFGAQIPRPDGRGGQRLVGEYALHVSCPWRWRAPSGFVRADDSSDTAVLGALSQPLAHVTSVEREHDAQLTFRFDTGDTLEIDDRGYEPASDEEFEYWRFFQPGLNTPHLVASSAGVEWHEA